MRAREAEDRCDVQATEIEELRAAICGSHTLFGGGIENLAKNDATQNTILRVLKQEKEQRNEH